MHGDEHPLDDLIDYAALLESVEVPLDSREVPYDPEILERLVSENEMVQRYLEMQKDSDGCGRRGELLKERVAECARRILPLKEKLCILALLSTGGSIRDVGRMLGVPKDSVRRALARATEKLAAVLSPDQPLLPGGEKVQDARLHFVVIKDESAAERLQKFLRRHPARCLSHAFDEGGVLTVCVLVEKR
ncbi:helix-turn-helix domain-containing protein [bacterium]|nr:helix-turn-helix domain-containing protein [bacterium]